MNYNTNPQWVQHEMRARLEKAEHRRLVRTAINPCVSSRSTTAASSKHELARDRMLRTRQSGCPPALV